MTTTPRQEKKIAVKFLHFWPNFDWRERFRFLAPWYDVHESDDPDFLIYSSFIDGRRLLKMPVVRSTACRIFYSVENIRPDMKRCDYAFTFWHDDAIRDPRHFRLPNYATRLWHHHVPPRELDFDDDRIDRLLAGKRRFCNFMYKNPRARERNRFFELLSRYKHVHAPGDVLRNTDDTPPPFSAGSIAKAEFLRPYKFTIAFERATAPGYTTEKLVEARLAGTVPIYWGDPLVHRDFNTKSFISFYDHGESLEQLAKRVEEVDQDDGLYRSYLSESFFVGGVTSKYLTPYCVLESFKQIFG